MTGAWRIREVMPVPQYLCQGTNTFFFPSPRIMGHHRIISNLQSPTKDLLIIDFCVSFVLKYQLARQGNNPKINFALL